MGTPPAFEPAARLDTAKLLTLAGGIVRLVPATVGGWMAVHTFAAWRADLASMVALSYAPFALLNAVALRRGAWLSPRSALRASASE